MTKEDIKKASTIIDESLAWARDDNNLQHPETRPYTLDEFGWALAVAFDRLRAEVELMGN